MILADENRNIPLDVDRILECAKSIIDSIQKKNYENIGSILDDMSNMREWTLFRELGKLTRDLHDSMNLFRNDMRFADLAAQEFPDAKARLNHVINLTEKAADKTLSAVEAAIPIADEISVISVDISGRWKSFRRGEMSVSDFSVMADNIDDFFESTITKSGMIQGLISDVLMAQGFQDITGQLIRKVIDLVNDVEQSLVNLIRLSGTSFVSVAYGEEKSGNSSRSDMGPVVPGVDSGDSVSGQDEVDSLLSKLGF